MLAAFGKIFANAISTHVADYTITAADQGKLFSVTGTSTLTLPAVASAGAPFSVIVLNAGTSVVTIDGDGAETINGVAAVYVGPGEYALVISSGSAWTAAITRRLPNRIQSKAANYVALVSDVSSLIAFTAAATLTLPNVAVAGHGFRIAARNDGSGAVTISGDANVNGLSLIVLAAGQDAELFCDGSLWIAFVSNYDSQLRKKTANETVNNSTTLQDDDHLVGYSLAADRYYRINGILHMDGTLAADMKFALVFTNAPQKALLYTDGGSSSTPGSTISVSFVATEVFIKVTGYFRSNATTGGTMKLQWAQDTAEVSDLTVREGSWLEIERM